MERILYKSIVILILVLIANCSFAQDDSLTLSNEEINDILYKIDTASGDRNFHIVFQNVDDGVFLADIWINDRLGGTMFDAKGLRICRLYNINDSYVFIYEFRQCDCDVPSALKRKPSSDPYAYLKDSPFYAEHGFHKTIMIEKHDEKIKFGDAEYSIDDSIENYLKDILKD